MGVLLANQSHIGRCGGRMIVAGGQVVEIQLHVPAAEDQFDVLATGDEEVEHFHD